MALAPGVPVAVPRGPAVATRRGVGQTPSRSTRPSLAVCEAQAVPVPGPVAGGALLVTAPAAGHAGEGVKAGRPAPIPAVGRPVNVVGAIRKTRPKTGVPVATVLALRRAAARAPAQVPAPGPRRQPVIPSFRRLATTAIVRVTGIMAVPEAF